MNCTAANRLACQVRTTRSRGVLQPPPPPLIARTRSRRVIDAFLRIPRGGWCGVFCLTQRRGDAEGFRRQTSDVRRETRGAMGGVLGPYRLTTTD